MRRLLILFFSVLLVGCTDQDPTGARPMEFAFRYLGGRGF